MVIVPEAPGRTEPKIRRAVDHTRRAPRVPRSGPRPASAIEVERRQVPPAPAAHKKRRTSRATRWEWYRQFRRLGSDVLPSHQYCQTRLGDSVSVGVSGGVAHVGGIRRCGSPWVCPLCGPAVREQRAREIDVGVAEHLSTGKAVLMVTLTIPHQRHHSLRESLDVVKNAWRKSVSGRAGQAMREDLGVIGTIRATEVTHGDAHGWHPHLHLLLLLDRDRPDETGLPPHLKMASAAKTVIYKRWKDQVEKLGYKTPSYDHGVDVRMVSTSKDLAKYLTKVEGGWGAGLELARLDVKKGRSGNRSPWQLWRSFLETGDLADFRLWQEYEDATKGTRALVWSPGLKAQLGVDEMTDEEAAAVEAEEAIEAGHVVQVEGELWDRLTHVGAVPQLLDQIEAAVSGGLPLPPGVTQLKRPL